MTLADSIRKYVVKQYLEPIRHKKSVVPASVTIVSGDIVRQLRLNQRVPAVCGALDAQKFLKENGLKLMSRTGPKFGLTAKWTFLA